jgi:phage-related protein
MKIKKFKQIKENLDPFDSYNSFDDDITVKIIFSGEEEIPLTSIKDTDRYKENYDSYEDREQSLKDLIFYSIEDYIYNAGIGGYTYELYDKDGNLIDLDMYLATKKYNL